tara:strand:+ start:140 stop:667 length:528 start_codon:yes stop_codon:yes gene_type:complete
MGKIYWFSGLSGVGKSSIAQATKKLLLKENFKVLILDGDDIRNKINIKLSFTPSDILENNRLIINICKKHSSQYDVILVPIISPYEKSRKLAKKLLGKNFYLIYIQASIEILKKRDTKGLYLQQERGEIDNLIGFSKINKYEKPHNFNLLINTQSESLTSSSEKLYSFILKHTIT